MGKYNYKHKDITFKGDFNIYQAKNGAIMLLMVKRAVEQVNKLPIDCYALKDFDVESFSGYYVNSA